MSSICNTPGAVTLNDLHAQAESLGKPVVYYLFKSHNCSLSKLVMLPTGNVLRYGEFSHPGTHKTFLTESNIRFDNWFFAYAYALRRRKEKERKKDEAMARRY